MLVFGGTVRFNPETIEKLALFEQRFFLYGEFQPAAKFYIEV